MESKKKSTENYGNEIKIIVGKFNDLYKKKYGLSPTVNYGLCGKMIKNLLENHSAMGIIRVIELYFEYEEAKVYHLPTIISAYYMNKYLPMARLNPQLYSDAHEYNKDIY